MNRFLILVGILTAFSFSTAKAADAFRIKSLRETRSTDMILVGRNWVNEPRRLLVTLRVENDTPRTAIIVRAYFFDKDGKEVERIEEPNAVWMRTSRGVEEVGLPTMLEKNKDIEVYFALTKEMDVKQWKSIVVVFGNETSVAARSLPAAAISTLDFAEKSRMTKDQN